MPTEYTAAPEVEKVARKLINSNHTHLAAARLVYVFAEKRDKEGQLQPIESKGKQRWGQARKVSGLNAFLSREQGSDEGEDYFVIEICAWAWKHLPENARVALVDHELCHCTYDGEADKPTIRPHDVEEFGEVIRRHGLWRPDVEDFIKIGAAQMKLGFDKPGDGSALKAGKTKPRAATPAAQ